MISINNKPLSFPSSTLTCCRSGKCPLASWGCRRGSVSHQSLIGCCGCPSCECPRRWTQFGRWTWWTARRRRRAAGPDGQTETSSPGGLGQGATPPPAARTDSVFWFDELHARSSSGRFAQFLCDGRCTLLAWLCPLTLKSEERTWWEWNAASPAWYMTWSAEQRTTASELQTDFVLEPCSVYTQDMWNLTITGQSFFVPLEHQHTTHTKTDMYCVLMRFPISIVLCFRKNTYITIHPYHWLMSKMSKIRAKVNAASRANWLAIDKPEQKKSHILTSTTQCFWGRTCISPVVIRTIEGSSSDPKLGHFLHHLPPVWLTEQSLPVLSNDLQTHTGTWQGQTGITKQMCWRTWRPFWQSKNKSWLLLLLLSILYTSRLMTKSNSTTSHLLFLVVRSCQLDLSLSEKKIQNRLIYWAYVYAPCYHAVQNLITRETINSPF